MKTVKDWYTIAYPTDDLGPTINPSVTFTDFILALMTGKDIYDFLGVQDSLIRERIFTYLSNELDMPYDYFYNLWLNPITK